MNDIFGFGAVGSAVADEASQVMDSLDKTVIRHTIAKKQGKEYIRTEYAISKFDLIFFTIMGLIWYQIAHIIKLTLDKPEVYPEGPYGWAKEELIDIYKAMKDELGEYKESESAPVPGNPAWNLLGPFGGMYEQAASPITDWWGSVTKKKDKKKKKLVSIDESKLE